MNRLELIILISSLAGCTTETPKEDTGIDRVLSVANYSIDCGDGECLKDEPAYVSVTFAYSGTGDEINSTTLVELRNYFPREEEHYFSLSRNISADPYKFEGEWTPETNTNCCYWMDCSQNEGEETTDPTLYLYVDVIYLATVTERLKLEEYVTVYDYKCTE